jgi:hypothetical protein
LIEGQHMQRLVRLASLAIYAIAVLGMLLLGGSQYDWMSEVDPAHAATSIETDGSRNLVRTLLLLAALGAMTGQIFKSKTRGERTVPLVLSVLAAAIYAYSRS